MVVVLLKLVFSLVSALSDLITRAIFTAAAHVLVQMIQALKVPGEGSQRVLEQVRDMIKACLGYLVDLLIQAITSVFSSLFDLVKEGVLNSSSGVAAAVAGLVEKSRTSLDEAAKEIPELLNALAEMIGKIVTDVLKNCNEAITHVTENVLK